MSEKICKIYGIDNGYCRVNYIAINKAGQRIYYCIQEEGENLFMAYRSTSDEEPQHEVACNKEIWEVPTGDSTIEKNVRRFLTGDL